VTELSNREIVDRYLKALSANDWPAMTGLQCPDYTEDMPQSGERIRGSENWLAVLQNYPGGLEEPPEHTRLTGTEDRWVATPSFTLLKVEGTGDTYMYEGKAAYPNGENWHMVVLMKVRDGKIAHSTAYYAPPFDPPAWRAPWVERL
jgi:ketosteroid isomerase-like protein